jgi:hypothetical protein
MPASTASTVHSSSKNSPFPLRKEKGKCPRGDSWLDFKGYVSFARRWVLAEAVHTVVTDPALESKHVDPTQPSSSCATKLTLHQ